MNSEMTSLSKETEEIKKEPQKALELRNTKLGQLSGKTEMSEERVSGLEEGAIKII